MTFNQEAMEKFFVHAVNCPTCCYDGMLECDEVGKLRKDVN